MSCWFYDYLTQPLEGSMAMPIIMVKKYMLRGEPFVTDTSWRLCNNFNENLNYSRKFGVRLLIHSRNQGFALENFNTIIFF